jgi:hypothetical protein
MLAGPVLKLVIVSGFGGPRLFDLVGGDRVTGASVALPLPVTPASLRSLGGRLRLGLRGSGGGDSIAVPGSSVILDRGAEAEAEGAVDGVAAGKANATPSPVDGLRRIDHTSASRTSSCRVTCTGSSSLIGSGVPGKKVSK